MGQSSSKRSASGDSAFSGSQREHLCRVNPHRESSSTSSFSSCCPGINHEVFLSFRGPDTRNDFTDLLYRDLTNAGIVVFIDNKNLRGGEKISQALKDAIKRSRISIAIFSEDYASSKSCLMELVQMWECSQSDEHTIIPIFYDVAPDDVKNQAGAFATSFVNHDADGKVHKDTIKTWKEVLRLVGGKKGFERAKIDGGRMTGLLREVVKRVRQLLRKDHQVVTNKQVGIELHVQELMKKLGVAYSDGRAVGACGEDVRVVGIHGPRGVGKTTTAKVVYNKIHPLFHACCFLEGVNSKGVVSSQEKLIADLQKGERESLGDSKEGINIISSLFRTMKVLIVLDDVHDDKQIKGLAGEIGWFGPGSRIIVTTHRKNVLKCFDSRAVEEHEVKPMGDGDALDLFTKHAFPGGAPPGVPEYVSLSRDIVKALGGLPMAIVLRAEYLKENEDIEIWRNTRDSLHDHPNERAVLDALEASYETLGMDTKEIFLDIACFFNGKDERIPSHMWKACGYRLPSGIKLLRDLHLLEDGENNELRMHALIREFGRDKVVKGKESFERCRFWNHSDVRPILDICTHPERVKGIGLTVGKDSFTCEEFGKMSSLRYLGLDRARINGNTENLPRQLRWLDWRECDSIPELDNMQLDKLVILALSSKEVTKDSIFWSQIKEKVKELKVLNLQGWEKLEVSFNFPAPTELEILILEDCTQLFQIGPFIRDLTNLSSLNLRNCSRVTELPQALYSMETLTELLIDGTGIRGIHCQEGSLKNLETLSACGCEKLTRISTMGHLRKLKRLALDGAPIDNWHAVPFEFPPNLRRLSLRNCRHFGYLPPSIKNLTLLEEMDLSYTGITEMPQSVKHLSNLKTLKMERTHLDKFPENIVELKNLEEIDFSLCRSMKGQDSCDLSGLSSLRILRLASSNVAGLPEGIRCLSRLQTLDVSKCQQLQALPELPSSLLSLCWGSKSMEVPNLTNLTNLKELSLIHDMRSEAGSTNQTPDIGWIAGLTSLESLETLELSLPDVANLPGNLSALTQLRKLILSHMKELDLTQHPLPSTLWTLRLKHCKIQVPKFSGLKYLSELELEECDLAETHDIEKLKLLEVLTITDCNGVTNLNGLKRLRRLRKVKVHPFEFDSATLSELRRRGCEVDTAVLLS